MFEPRTRIHKDNAILTHGPTKPKLIRFFYTVLSIFPFTIATLLGIRYYCEAATLSKYFAPTLSHRGAVACIFGIVIIVGIGTINSFRKKRYDHLSFFGIMLILVCITLIPRALFLIQIGQYAEPVSDFKWAFEHALGEEDYTRRYQIFPSWGCYSFFLNMLFMILPQTYVSVQIVNIALDCAIACSLAALLVLMTGKKHIAFLGGCLYALSPSRIAYSMILTPEIPACLLFLFALILIAKCNNAKNIGKWLFLLASIGILLQLGSCLKPIGSVYLAGIVITTILFSNLLTPASYKPSFLHADKLSKAARRFATSLLAIFLIFISFGIAKVICYSTISNWLEAPVQDSPVSHFLYIGLRTDGEGQVHLGDRSLPDQLYADPMVGLDEINVRLMDDLAKDYSENASKLPKLLFTKIIWAWQDDAIPLHYIEAATTASKALSIFSALGQVFYIAVMAFAGFGVFMILRRRMDDSALAFLLCALIFGFALLLLVSEAQSRYKVMIMPYIYCLSALGFTEMCAKLSNLIRDGKKLKRQQNTKLLNS